LEWLSLLLLPFTNHPQINVIVQRFNEEKHYFSKIHRMIDLIEVLIKTHTAYIISDYFRIKDISENIKGLLANGLITPSLGLWKVFGSAVLEDIMIKKKLTSPQFEQIISLISKEQRIRFEEMYHQLGNAYYLNKYISLAERTYLRKKIFKKNNYKFSDNLFLESFFDDYFKWENNYLNEKISTESETIENVIHLRNKYAHGASPIKAICEKDLNDYFPVLQKMLEEKWLNETTIIVMDEEGNTIPFSNSLEIKDNQQAFLSNEARSSLRPFIPYLVRRDQAALSLFPIISYKYIEEEAGHSLVFFNDAKKYEKSSISLLDYSSGLHIDEQEAFAEFQEIINIAEWKSLVTEDFKALINQKLENFYGREKEQQDIKEIIQKKDRGFLRIFGDPGIGKSSIMAQMIHHYMNGEDIHIIEYFFERNSRISNFLTTIHEKVNRIRSTSIPIGRTIEEMQSNLIKKLSDFSMSSNQKKLVFFLDGIDTGLQEDPALLHFLPAKVYKNVFFVFSSRRTSEALEYTEGLPSEYLHRFDLKSLSDENIRGILYKTVNKYKIIDKYVQELTKRSGGNPLYIKLLCNAIENGEIPINSIESLPYLSKTEPFDHFYHQILNRYDRKSSGKELLTALYTFAAAKDYLTADHLAHMMDIQESEARILITELGEILSENPSETGSFQLFHESLREFLFEKRRHPVLKQVKVILEFCKERNNLTIYDKKVLSYIYRHYSSHLLDCIKSEHFPKAERNISHDLFVQLMFDDSFINAQIETTGEFGYSFAFYKQAIELFDHTSILPTQELQRKFVQLAAKAGQLHLRLSNSSKEILSFNEFHDLDKLKLVLERIKYLHANEQSIMYIYLLFQALQAQDPWKKCVDLILESMNKHSMMDASIINWNDIIPKNLFFWVVVKCYELNSKYHYLLFRLRILEKAELQEVDRILRSYCHGDYQSLMDEIVLNMVDNSAFLLAYFMKQIEYEKNNGFYERIEIILTKVKEFCTQSQMDVEKVSLLATAAKRLMGLGLEESAQDFADAAIVNIKEIQSIYDRPLLLLNVIEDWQKSLSFVKVEPLYGEFILFINELPQNTRTLKLLIELIITLAKLNREKEVQLLGKLIDEVCYLIPASYSFDHLIGEYLMVIRTVQNKKNDIQVVFHRIQLTLINKIFNWLYKDNELKTMVDILSSFGDFATAETLLPKVEDHYNRVSAIFSIMKEEIKHGDFHYTLNILEQQIKSDEEILGIFKSFTRAEDYYHTFKQFLSVLPHRFNHEDFPFSVLANELGDIQNSNEFESMEEDDYERWGFEEYMESNDLDWESSDESDYENDDIREESSGFWNEAIIQTPYYLKYQQDFLESLEEVNNLFYSSFLSLQPNRITLSQCLDDLKQTIQVIPSLPVNLKEFELVEQSTNEGQSKIDGWIDIPNEFPDDWEWITQKVYSYFGIQEREAILSEIIKELQRRTFVNGYGEYEFSVYYLELVCYYVIFHNLRQNGHHELLPRISNEFTRLFRRINKDGNPNFTYLGIEDGDLLEDFATEYMIIGESIIAVHLTDYTVNPYSSDFSEKWQELLRNTCEVLVKEEQWNKALEMVEKIKDISFQVEMRKQIALGVSRMNHVALETILEIIMQIKDVDQYYETIGEVAISFFSRGQKIEYERLLQMLPKGDYLASTLSKVACLLASEGNVRQSFLITKEISDRRLKEHTVKEIVPILLIQRKYKELFLLMGMVSNEVKLFLLETILSDIKLEDVDEMIRYVDAYLLTFEVKEYFYKELLKRIFQKDEYEVVLQILLRILPKILEHASLLGQILYKIAYFNSKLPNPDSQINSQIQEVVDLSSILLSKEDVESCYCYANLADWIHTLDPILKIGTEMLRNQVKMGELSESDFNAMISKHLKQKT
jgi:hypothetical protein